MGQITLADIKSEWEKTKDLKLYDVTIPYVEEFKNPCDKLHQLIAHDIFTTFVNELKPFKVKINNRYYDFQ